MTISAINSRRRYLFLYLFSFIIIIGILSISAQNNNNNNNNNNNVDELVVAEEEQIEIVTDEKEKLTCQKIITDDMRFTQENAPRDMTSQLITVTNFINKKPEITNVLAVSIDYSGDDIHSVVGEHDVIAYVRRLKDDDNNDNDNNNSNKAIKNNMIKKNEEITTCYNITFYVEDINECELQQGHHMRHRCHHTAHCENTIGSYECICESSHAIEGASDNKCSGKQSTAECCTTSTSTTPNDHTGAAVVPAACRSKKCLDDCKADFICQTDQCPGNCDMNADCKTMGNTYECTCKSGYIGNGHVCGSHGSMIAWVDTNHQLLGDMLERDYCGCQKPTIDYCAINDCKPHSTCHNLEDTHICICDEGFKDSEEHGCVDERLPELRMRGPNPYRLHQCDTYEEAGVDIIDNNLEDFNRMVQIKYSQPLGTCLMGLGDYHVNYTIETNWTYPPVVSITRQVQVLDINECQLLPKDVKCDKCVQHCVAGARCINTKGSYKCQCPSCTQGDGIEVEYGGTGCRDSCSPEIILKGENPYVFRTCKCEGLLGKPLEGCTPNFYSDVVDLVRSKRTNELCKEDICAKAIDRPFIKGKDYTNAIRVGEPFPLKDQLNTWNISYDVSDDAGNNATTVYRTIQVIQESLDEINQRMEKEIEERVEERMKKEKSSFSFLQRVPPVQQTCSGQACTINSNNNGEMKSNNIVNLTEQNIGHNNSNNDDDNENENNNNNNNRAGGVNYKKGEGSQDVRVKLKHLLPFAISIFFCVILYLWWQGEEKNIHAFQQQQQQHTQQQQQFVPPPPQQHTPQQNVYNNNYTSPAMKQQQFATPMSSASSIRSSSTPYTGNQTPIRPVQRRNTPGSTGGRF